VVARRYLVHTQGAFSHFRKVLSSSDHPLERQSGRTVGTIRPVVTFTTRLEAGERFKLERRTMPTTKECRHNAEICLMLASETTEIYVKTALIELATEFRALAELSEPARVVNQN
jgi:hypothetical protein